MSDLLQAVNDYLALRRALGYKLEHDGRELPRFVQFLEQHGAAVISTELALAWAIQPADATCYRPRNAALFRTCTPSRTSRRSWARRARSANR